jgi:hypothetical protein
MFGTWANWTDKKIRVKISIGVSDSCLSYLYLSIWAWRSDIFFNKQKGTIIFTGY